MNDKTTTMNRVISRRDVEIVKHFTNGFAQDVYYLADGLVIYINYSDTKMTIEVTEPIAEKDEINFINSLPEDKEGN